MSTTTVSPTNSSRSVIVPTASGGRFGTSTSKRCSARSPPGSVARTVTVVRPAATPVTVIVLPETVTAARSGFVEAAEYSST